MDFPHTTEGAKAYTGVPEYWGISGKAQLDFLKNEGLRQDHYILEVGCGSLNAAVPIIEYMHMGHYTGIEPEKWLVEKTIHLCDGGKFPNFIFNKHFDLEKLGNANKFDYVISHSVFSHAPEWQIIQCLYNIKPFLGDRCKLYFSLRLAEQDSDDIEWKDHPGNTFFTEKTIVNIANKLGYSATLRLDIKDFFIQKVPPDIHDWIQFSKI